MKTLRHLRHCQFFNSNVFIRLFFWVEELTLPWTAKRFHLKSSFLVSYFLSRISHSPNPFRTVILDYNNLLLSFPELYLLSFFKILSLLFSLKSVFLSVAILTSLEHADHYWGRNRLLTKHRFGFFLKFNLYRIYRWVKAAIGGWKCHIPDEAN